MTRSALIPAIILSFSLTACGSSPGERAVTGGVTDKDDIDMGD